MFEANVEKVLGKIGTADLVLDIGGWACPFNRANYVLDAEGFESRGYYEKIGRPKSQGGDKEHFTKETWIQRDICDRRPWPFKDKQFDFVICSHTLEDIRDPIGVCDEIMRVGKRGYIEIPSREWESCRGLEHHKIVGLSHHRWLIEVEESQIRFFQKYHIIHSDWRYSFPHSTFTKMSAERSVQWLFWEGEFSFEEVSIHGTDMIAKELAQYVERVHPYSKAAQSWGGVTRKISAFTNRVKNRLSKALS